ncbi:twin-arginine translocation signal domain-containing protein [Wolinella succinogenes]
MTRRDFLKSAGAAGAAGLYTATICQDRKTIFRYSHLICNPTQHS